MVDALHGVKPEEIKSMSRMSHVHLRTQRSPVEFKCLFATAAEEYVGLDDCCFLEFIASCYHRDAQCVANLIRGERILGGLWGSLVGDALGVQDSLKHMIGV